MDKDEQLFDDESTESDSLTGSDDDLTWISWFCSLRGNEFFCEVDEEYIQDDFNLTGLSSIVPYYDYALDTILDFEPTESFTDEQQEVIERAAEMLYGLIHARFILTSRGLTRMYEKFNDSDFGCCPRVFCQTQRVLPVGLSDVPRTSTVKVFCPRCQDVFYPKSRHCGSLDGAFFGTTFPHLLCMVYPEVMPKPIKASREYTPRVFGFRIHRNADDDDSSAAGAGASAPDAPVSLPATSTLPTPSDAVALTGTPSRSAAAKASSTK